jgi:hypothetical protein
MKNVGLIAFLMLVVSCSTLRVSPAPFVNEQVKESITDVALVEPQLNLPDRIAPAPLFEYDGAELALLPSFPVEEVPQTFDTPYLALSGLSPGLAEPELLPQFPEASALPQEDNGPRLASLQPGKSLDDTQDLLEPRNVNIPQVSNKGNNDPIISSATENEPYDESIFDHMEEIIVTSVPAPRVAAPTNTASTTPSIDQNQPRANVSPAPVLQQAETLIDFPAENPTPSLANPQYPQTRTPSASSVWDNPYLPSGQNSNQGVNPEDLVVKPGEEVYIQLSGQGWTNTTERMPEAFSLRMGLGGEDSQFILRPRTPGEYLLDFVQQDPLSGNLNYRQFLLKILGEGETLRENTVLNQEQDLSLEDIHDLIRYGKWAEAKDELFVHLDSRNPEAQYLSGLVHEKLGEFNAARSMYRRALTFPAGRPYVEKARKALFSHYLERGDYRALSDLVLEWPTGVSPPPEEDYLRGLEHLVQEGSLNQISDWTGRYGRWFPSPQKEDHFLFLYASLLEKPGDQRDLKLSRSLYQKLLDEYVLSPYYNEAQKRLNHIQQNFMYYR